MKVQAAVKVDVVGREWWRKGNKRMKGEYLVIS